MKFYAKFLNKFHERLSKANTHVNVHNNHTLGLNIESWSHFNMSHGKNKYKIVLKCAHEMCVCAAVYVITSGIASSCIHTYCASDNLL